MPAGQDAGGSKPYCGSCRHQSIARGTESNLGALLMLARPEAPPMPASSPQPSDTPRARGSWSAVQLLSWGVACWAAEGSTPRHAGRKQVWERSLFPACRCATPNYPVLCHGNVQRTSQTRTENRLVSCRNRLSENSEAGARHHFTLGARVGLRGILFHSCTSSCLHSSGLA
jgi:hypothetical protein